MLVQLHSAYSHNLFISVYFVMMLIVFRPPEIDLSEIEIEEEIGSGSFGKGVHVVFSNLFQCTKGNAGSYL